MNAQGVDVIDLYEVRKFVEKALSAAGVELTGAGIGCGEADLDVVINGHEFTISIREIVWDDEEDGTYDDSSIPIRQVVKIFADKLRTARSSAQPEDKIWETIREQAPALEQPIRAAAGGPLKLINPARIAR